MKNEVIQATPPRLVLASLRFHWRMHAAVGLGVAVACAILVGSLVVGDSVRSTLATLARERLGRFDASLVVGRNFAGDLGERLAASPGYPTGAPAPVVALLLDGSLTALVDGERGRHAGGVTVMGIDDRFGEVGFPAGSTPGGVRLLAPRPGSVRLNHSAAAELGVGVGDTVLLNLQKVSDAPLESFLGRREDAARSLRLEVAEILPDRGPGLFSLRLGQSAPRLAYLDRDDLARTIGTPGEANVLLVSLAADGSERPPVGSAIREAALESLGGALRSALRLSDVGLRLRRLEDPDCLSLESRRMILGESTVDLVSGVARRLGVRFTPVLTHLAESIELEADPGDVPRAIPYSTISALETALEPPLGPLRLVGGEAAPVLAEREILVNSWVADQFGLDPGSTDGRSLRVTYYVTDRDETTSTATARFTLRGVVALSGLGSDRHLTPEFPGITSDDVLTMNDWDPPFPFDDGRILEDDEEYWEEHRATPKAFVSPAAGQELFRTRYGPATSIRLAPPADQDLEGAAGRLSRELLERSGLPRTLGFTWSDVLSAALGASSGSTDFGMLFVSFSFFLILSAAILVALLFGLQVDRRAPEIGTYRALGFTASRVRRIFLGEALVVAGIGGVAGVGLALGYASLLIHGLQTVWWRAVQVPYLLLAPQWPSVLVGLLATEVVVLVAILIAARRLGRASPRQLLAGTPLSAAPGAPAARRRPSGSLVVGIVSGAVALALAAIPLAASRETMVWAFFGTGTTTLVSALAFFHAWLRSVPPKGRRGVARPGLLRLGSRNARRAATRSLLTAALVASATFVLVAVAANQHDPRRDRLERDSGNGGFALVATTETPLVPPLDTPEGREALALDTVRFAGDGGPPRDVEWEGLRSFPFRVRPGDDASCLNLYAPRSPRLLGAGDEFIDRAGFRFKEHIPATPREEVNPWLLLRRRFDDGAVPVIGDWNSTTWILKIGLGDDIVMRDGRDRELRLRLVATLSGSIFQRELLLAGDRFVTHFPDREGYRYFLLDLDASEGDREKRLARIEEGLERGLARWGMDVMTTPDLIASYLAVENTYLSTFLLLGGLGLMLGTLGLSVVLVRGVIERRGELALLRAVGFPRRRLSLLVLAEDLLLMVVGVGAGTLAAIVAVLPRLLDPAAIVPWPFLLGLLAIVFVVGVASGGGAVALALRAPIIGVLRQER